MLLYRMLCDCELKSNITICFYLCGKICFTPFIAKMARDILKVIMLLCFFHVIYLYVCIPNFTDSVLLYLPIWLITSLLILSLPFI